MTVGTQLPFDRLIRAVDDWAVEHGRDDVLAQIGNTEFRPKRMVWSAFLSSSASVEALDKADLIVAHAGTGTILGALQRSKPIIVMPRRAEFGEHRNNHQVATARCLGARGLVSVAEDETALRARLEDLSSIGVSQQIRPHADEELISFIAGFLGSARAVLAPGTQSELENSSGQTRLGFHEE